MQPNSQEMRRQFLRYFKEKDHTIVPSSPVVPHEDPTLLFTNAGMNQFKELFLGKEVRDYSRAVSAQKCIRAGGKHNDLDNVGHTARHLTFFEMLGNFSFGDYFKKEAIRYAWELSLNVFKLDPKRITISIYEQDDESFELWREWVPETKIVRMGDKDNFWAMGETGPCGPCSELYYDLGEKYGNFPSPKEDLAGVRHLEFWNLVFMQYNQSAQGSRAPLPKQSIDTGCGLERILAIISQAETLFATDVLRGLIAAVENLSGKKYGEDATLVPAFQVIADHIRSLSFAIADGAQPSNIERGYVLRKILRRAVRYGRMLKLEKPFMADLLPRLIDLMGEDFRELALAKERIAEILTLEEEAFLRTLKRGGALLGTVIEQAKRSPLKEIRGEEAFKLKDTYGLPLEEILLIAKDEKVSVNLESYQLLEEEAKEKSRGAQSLHLQEAAKTLFADFVKAEGPSQFVGYEEIATKARIVGISNAEGFVKELVAGEKGTIFLDKTPFYAEKGGQVGDTGILTGDHSHFQVEKCHSPYTNLIAHEGKLTQGSCKVGESVHASIDFKNRSLISHNHTATHLLHWALQHVLGAHIKQAGSLVDADKLRFDFNHHKPLSQEDIYEIEDLVNARIRENRPVTIYELSLAEAEKKQEIKQFFGEKYGSKVRVVDIDYSKELCGGTHVKQVGSIGLFRITKESSIAAGVRRIEAVTGSAAEAFARGIETLAERIAFDLKTPLARLPEKIAALLEEKRELTIELKSAKQGNLKQLAEKLLQTKEPIGDLSFLAKYVDLDASEMALLAEEILNHSDHLVLVLATKTAERAQLLVRIHPSLVQKGLDAGKIIKEIAPAIDGSGGGRKEMAQAGGKNPDGIENALDKARQFLKSSC